MVSELREAAKRYRIAATKYKAVERDVIATRATWEELEQAEAELEQARAEWNLIKAEFRHRR